MTLNSRFITLTAVWRCQKILEDEHDTSLKKEDECEAEIKGPLLIHFWLKFLFQACYHVHITHSPSAILVKFARLFLGMTQYFRWWAWNHLDYRKLNVNLKLNGPLLIHWWPIFLFQKQFHAHLPHIVPRMSQSSLSWQKVFESEHDTSSKLKDVHEVVAQITSFVVIFGSSPYFEPWIMPILHRLPETYYCSCLDCKVGDDLIYWMMSMIPVWKFEMIGNVNLNWPHLVCIRIIIFILGIMLIFHGMYVDLQGHHYCTLNMRYSIKMEDLQLLRIITLDLIWDIA